MFKAQGSGGPTRYDVWIEPNGQELDRVIVAVAALLGLDLRLARKLVESGSPVRRGVREREVHSLHARFGHWGLGVRVEPGFPGPLDLPPPLPLESPADLPPALVTVMEWMAQGFVGLMLGILIGGVVLEVAWDGPLEASLLIVPLLVSCIVPLLVSCAVGLFWGFRRPGFTLRRLMGVVGVVAVLLSLMVEGPKRIEHWFDRGQSSDYTGVGATLLFLAFCIAIAAPLSAALTLSGGVSKS